MLAVFIVMSIIYWLEVTARDYETWHVWVFALKRYRLDTTLPDLSSYRTIELKRKKTVGTNRQIV